MKLKIDGVITNAEIVSFSEREKKATIKVTFSKENEIDIVKTYENRKIQVSKKSYYAHINACRLHFDLKTKKFLNCESYGTGTGKEISNSEIKNENEISDSEIKNENEISDSEIKNENEISDSDLDFENENLLDIKNVKVKNYISKLPEHLRMMYKNVVLDQASYIFGPAGTGKSFSVEQMANFFKLDFYAENSLKDEFKVSGFIDANGVCHSTEFRKAWTNGGLMLLDELDGSSDEVVLLLNNALANGYMSFPDGTFRKHEKFRLVAGGNTDGTGATEYTARTELDPSTLDRFKFIKFWYDENVELQLANGDKEFIEFIHMLRERQIKGRLKGVLYTYRCIKYVIQEIEYDGNYIDAFKQSLIKGLSKDNALTLCVPDSKNKYMKKFIAIVNEMN